MNWLNYVMVRQKDRDGSSKLSTTKVELAALSWVSSLTSKSEDKEEAHSWVGDQRGTVENVVFPDDDDT